MKRKGFTLIELLAVIVVLAIITLIATPIIMNLIKNAQKGASERSAENYLSAVETMVATQRIDGIIVEDGIYTVDSNGNLIGEEKTYNVEINGNIPKVGSKISIVNGKVVATGTKMTIGDYKVIIDLENKVVAFLPMCKLVSGEAYAVGSEYKCDPGDGEKTFYVLENLEDSENISLIMDRNLDGTVAWCGDETKCKKDGNWHYEYGPITALEELEEKTSNWNNSQIISIDLPTYRQIYNVNNSKSLAQTLWLYKYLDNDSSTTYPLGYWTSTGRTSVSYDAWYVYYMWELTSMNIDNKKHLGIRPVITIAKSNI